MKNGLTDLLSELDIHNSVGPGRIREGMLRETDELMPF